MSILSLGRPIRTADAPRERWWNWNPARPGPVVAPAAAATAEPWWRWNPYRRTAHQIDAQGQRVGYAKGARDEQRVMVRRERRRSHPIIGFVVLLAAACGAGFVGLAYETGSFAGGGAVIDRTLADWRADMMGAAGRAGAQGGRTVQSVGQTLSTQSRQLSQGG